MEKREEFNTRLKKALKERDEITTATMRLVIAALKDRDIDARAKGRSQGISDDEILAMLQSMIKQRKESVQTYKDAGRFDLADREEEEIKIIEGFLPRQLSEEEVKARIDEVIAETNAQSIKDMGKVIGQLKSKYAGQIDISKASALVRQKLN